MHPNETPFPAAWFSIELKGFRNMREFRTYDAFSYEELPPLPLPSQSFCGDFEWLKASELQAVDEEEAVDLDSQIERLVTLASQIGLSLPEEFVRFMKSPDLPNRIRSCTGCFFELPDEIIENPAGAGGFLIRFLSDSQGCLFWYLYLNGAGEHCIVASYKLFGSEGEFERSDSDEESEIFFCAARFEQFVYRFWIENEIWYWLAYGRKPLTPEQQNYVNHYKK